MIISILKETAEYEQRVAATPETVQKFIAEGFKVQIESNAGMAAGFEDSLYRDAGAVVFPTASQTAENCNLLLKIQAPSLKELQILPDECTIVADFRLFELKQNQPLLTPKKATCFALEKIPRISRAQNMDILSSQDNLAGYKAVLEAVNISKKAMPMMITAAGTIAPAKIMVVGIGVAGLQAIATAKRLGAIVFASDIRPETQEQAESLGARFVRSDELNARMKEMDIIITAAGSPGKAPKLFETALAEKWQPGCVVTDISGNFRDLDSPQTAIIGTVTLVSDQMMAALLSHSASRLFASNLYNFATLLYSDGQNQTGLNFDDPIINQTCICSYGKIREENL